MYVGVYVCMVTHFSCSLPLSLCLSLSISCTHSLAFSLSISVYYQKRVVDLVKKNKSAVTLAIGDGANDVGMIKGKVHLQHVTNYMYTVSPLKCYLLKFITFFLPLSLPLISFSCSHWCRYQWQRRSTSRVGQRLLIWTVQVGFSFTIQLQLHEATHSGHSQSSVLYAQLQS